MTAIQLNAMNQQIWQGIGGIADSEPLMKRLFKFVSTVEADLQDCLTHLFDGY